jgi:RCC1 and BTB domain-containing protein
MEGINNVTYVSCGYSHTAVIANGDLYTFGSGFHGQLGHGNKGNQESPKKVEGINNITYVSCGSYFTAVIANDLVYHKN